MRKLFTVASNNTIITQIFKTGQAMYL